MRSFTHVNFYGDYFKTYLYEKNNLTTTNFFLPEIREIKNVTETPYELMIAIISGLSEWSQIYVLG